MFNGITASTSVSVAENIAAQNRLPQQTLDQDDFLKLLVTQMTSQDPLNPKSDGDFIAQMAQFSALEQSKSMQSDIAKMRSEQEILQANSLLGRTVQIQADSHTKLSGLVSSVQVEAGTPKITVDGQSYDLSQLLTISPSQAAT